jgi:hypothetical protein
MIGEKLKKIKIEYNRYGGKIYGI